MKVIIDLIEDIREAVGNDKGLALSVMGLRENSDGEFTPSWQSNIGSYRIDTHTKKMFFFLGREEALKVGALLEVLNALSNEAMMYELCVSYTKENQRVDTPLIGFGESLADNKYYIFISDGQD